MPSVQPRLLPTPYSTAGDGGSGTRAPLSAPAQEEPPKILRLFSKAGEVDLWQLERRFWPAFGGQDSGTAEALPAV